MGPHMNGHIGIVGASTDLDCSLRCEQALRFNQRNKNLARGVEYLAGQGV